MAEKKEPELNIEIVVKKNDTVIARVNTYSFEMAEVQLGSLERFYKKCLKDEKEEKEKS